MQTRRSAIVQYQRCPRSRYLLYEYQGKGLEPVRESVPLSTGIAVHLGAGALLQGTETDEAVRSTLEWYDEVCEKRGLILKELEEFSFVYKEQRALIEGLIWLLSLRVIPKLLEEYEVLEVERPGKISNFASGVDLNYRPDALLRRRDDSDLYILSWKTAGQLRKWNIEDAWVAPQTFSEPWAREMDGLGKEIQGVQMIFLVKGRKVPIAGQGSPEDESTLRRRLDSPLIWGYKDSGFPPQLAGSREWRCTDAHPMRKSQWYPTGECPGDGRLHLRGKDWESFPVWESIGVKDWLAQLVEIDPRALDKCWAMPAPFFRTPAQTERWLRQARTQEGDIADDLLILDKLPIDSSGVWTPGYAPTTKEQWLDQRFPMYTHTCNNFYGGQCPCYEICWGPLETREDPLNSGLYQIRTPDAVDTLDLRDVEGDDDNAK